jgi:hypothetical protein
MSQTAEIAEAYRLAEAIENARKAGTDSREAERQYFAFLRGNQAALEPHLPYERNLFYTFPLDWDDIKRLADAGLQYYLDAVREYNFEGWSGDQLPPEFFLMRNIVSAYLSGTDFESIAGDYASLSKLEELVAEEVWTLRFLDDPSVAEAPAIKRVYLNACGLEVFPQQLYKAETLEELSISYCRTREDMLYPFYAIPRGISRLTRLKVLDLAGIGLTNVPLEILEMTWLEKLNLMSNDIPEIDQGRLRAALPNTKILF